MEVCMPRAHALPQEKPLQWEAPTWLESSPCLPQLEKARAEEWRPSAAKNKSINNFTKRKNCRMGLRWNQIILSRVCFTHTHTNTHTHTGRCRDREKAIRRVGVDWRKWILWEGLVHSQEWDPCRVPEYTEQFLQLGGTSMRHQYVTFSLFTTSVETHRSPPRSS